jgi:hypothetical protein
LEKRAMQQTAANLNRWLRTPPLAPATRAAANDNLPCPAERARAEAVRCRAMARRQQDQIKRLSWEWLAEKFDRLALDVDHVLSRGSEGTTPPTLKRSTADAGRP